MKLWRVLSSPPERLWPEAVVHHGARVAMLLGLALVVAVGFPPNPRVADVSGYEAGVVATDDLIAEVEFAVPKSATELERDRAAAVAAVPMIYRYRPEAGDSTADALNRFFATVEEILGREPAALDSVLAAENIAATPALVEMLRDPAVREAIHRAGLRAARELIPGGVVDATTRDYLGDRITVLEEGGERFVPAAGLLTATDLYNRSAELLPPDASPEATEILRLLLIRFREFSYLPNQEATAAGRTAARQSVVTTRGNVLAGEAILRANQQVTEEDLVRLRAYEQQLRTLGLLGASATGFLPSLGVYLLQVLLLGMLWIVLWAYRGEVYTNFRWMLLLALLLATYFASAIVISRVAIFPPELLPIAFVTLSVAVVWDGRLALMLALVLAAVTASLTPFQGVGVMVTTMVGGGAAALSVGVVRRRSQSWTFIAIIAASYACVTLSLWLSRMQPAAGVLPSIGWTTGNAIVSAGLALLFVPAFEWFTGVTTDQTLLEFADPNRTLLKRLSMEAPGTYAHTVNVANLAEAAGTAIGANGLLCRVGTYYHDVGKVLEPQYFIENQHGGVNPHDRLEPSISAAILRRHVVEGLRLARREKLPAAISAFIAEHHGTQRIGYFYGKALEQAGGEDVDATEFHYAGPKPQSRETAVLLLADPVESASRTLRDPTPERIRAMIDAIVDSRVAEGQLDEAPLTFAHISLVKEQFATVLEAMYHRRVDYPETEHISNPAADAAPPRDGVDAPATPGDDEDRATSADNEDGAISAGDEDGAALVGDDEDPAAAAEDPAAPSSPTA